MRRLVFMAMAVLMVSMVIPTQSSAGIAAGEKGDMDLNIGAILQAGFTYHMEDSATVNQFWLKRARLLMSGTIVPDKVKYFVQAELNGAPGAPAILDYKARFFYVPQTEIAFGRFLPNYTLYMPVSTAKLEMINYPVTTAMTAMWRQTGVQTTTKTEFVDFNLGLFNGADIPNNKGDNNDAKDYFVRADFKPPIGDGDTIVRVGGFYWMNTWHDAVMDIEEDGFSDTHMGFFGKLDYPLEDMTVKFRGEYVMSAGESGDVDDPTTTDAGGFFAHAALQIDEQWEGLLRFESWDPNTDSESENDSFSVLTVGVNHYISGINSMIYLNFIHTMYEHEDMDAVDTIQTQVQIAL